MKIDDILAIGITAVILGFVVSDTRAFKSRAKDWRTVLWFSGSMLLWLAALITTWGLALRRDLQSALLELPLTVVVLKLCLKVITLGQREKPEVG